MSNVHAFHEEYLIAYDSIGCLLGYEFLPQHFLGEAACLSILFDHVDSALKAVLEATEASTSGEHLCLDDHVLSRGTGCVK